MRFRSLVVALCDSNLLGGPYQLMSIWMSRVVVDKLIGVPSPAGSET